MTNRKLRKLNNSRTTSIDEYTNNLHDKVAELYEALMDNEIDEAVKIQRSMTSILRSLKIN